MRFYFEIFFSFFKIGAFTIGGGYAMIPLIEKEVVARKKWIEKKDFADMLAMAQAAPGPISVNTAVFVGYKLCKWKGSIPAVLGAILPSFIIILLVAMFFSNTIRTNETIEGVFKGIRPVVVALIAIPAFQMLIDAGLKFKPLAITIVATLSISLLHLSPVWVIIAAGLVGLFSNMYKNNRTQ